MSEEENGSIGLASGDNNKDLTRRDFLRLTAVSAVGAAVNATKTYGALKAAEELSHSKEPEIVEVKFGDTGEVGIQAYPEDGKVKYFLRPYGLSRSEATLTHVGTSRSSELAPRQLIFKAAELALKIQKAVAKRLIRPSSGEKYRLAAALFPVEIAGRIAELLKNKAETRDLDLESPLESVNLSGDNFEWVISDERNEYKGSGFVKQISENDQIQFISGEDFPGRNVVGMKPDKWLKEFVGVDEVVGHCDEKFGNMPLLHSVGNAFIVKKEANENGKKEILGIAGTSANPASISYAEIVVSNRNLTPAENIFLNNLAPFVTGKNKPSPEEIEWISEFPEKAFDEWKQKYPDKPYHQGQTYVFNQEKGTFRIIEQEDRKTTIENLAENEVWMTLGEVMLLDGEKRYTNEVRFDEPFDMNLNGFLAVPMGDGTYRPRAMVTTDQLKRLSLSQTEDIVEELRKQLELPEGTVFFNLDKHGAGGIFVAEK